MVRHLGWVDIHWVIPNFQCLHSSARANGNVADLAEKLGKIVEHLNQSQNNHVSDRPPARLGRIGKVYRDKSKEPPNLALYLVH